MDARRADLSCLSASGILCLRVSRSWRRHLRVLGLNLGGSELKQSYCLVYDPRVLQSQGEACR